MENGNELQMIQSLSCIIIYKDSSLITDGVSRVIAVWSGDPPFHRARRDGAGQIWTSPDSSKAARDLHNSGAARNTTAPTTPKRIEMAPSHGRDIQDQLPALQEHRI